MSTARIRSGFLGFSRMRSEFPCHHGSSNACLAPFAVRILVFWGQNSCGSTSLGHGDRLGGPAVGAAAQGQVGHASRRVAAGPNGKRARSPPLLRGDGERAVKSRVFKKLQPEARTGAPRTAVSRHRGRKRGSTPGFDGPHSAPSTADQGRTPRVDMPAAGARRARGNRLGLSPPRPTATWHL